MNIQILSIKMIKFCVLTVSLLIIFHWQKSTILCDTCSFNENSDYVGKYVAFYRAFNVSECCTRCSQVNDCFAWTFDSKRSLCFLKSSAIYTTYSHQSKFLFYIVNPCKMSLGQRLFGSKYHLKDIG